MLSLLPASWKPALHSLATSKVLEPLPDAHLACRSLPGTAAQCHCLAVHCQPRGMLLVVLMLERDGCRLLDDNRELFVPELRETVKPHPHFMLFATQNPPGECATWPPAP